jgi:hypothetical protein
MLNVFLPRPPEKKTSNYDLFFQTSTWFVIIEFIIGYYIPKNKLGWTPCNKHICQVSGSVIPNGDDNLLKQPFVLKTIELHRLSRCYISKASTKRYKHVSKM